MAIMFLSASDMSLADGALYALIGFVIVLLVLALLVGIFYLSGFIFQSKLFSKEKKPKADKQQTILTDGDQATDDEADEQLLAVIAAAVASVYASEYSDGDAPEFVIKRVRRKK